MEQIKDSGSRTEFSTGAVRDAQTGEKGAFDLLPMYALYKVARVFEDGGKKYQKHNWRKGIPLSRYADSAMRHLAKAIAGFTDEPHYSQAAWNILCLIETKYMIESGKLPKELDDLPDFTGKDWY